MRPAVVRILCLLGLTALLAVSDASAQHPPRSGFWVQTGIGSGAARNACTGCEEVAVAYGTASQLRVGAALSQNILFGLEIFVFNGDEIELEPGGTPGESENVSISPIVVWYPGESGIFLKGGVGVTHGTFSVTPEQADAVTTTGTGSGLTFGVGLDLPVFSWLALSANLGTYVSAVGDLRLENQLVDDVIATMYEAGLALTIR